MSLANWLSADSVAGRRWVVGAFFGLLALLGVALHRDYGVSWDESNNHLNGLVNLKYLASWLPKSSAIRHHPTFATTPDIRNFQDAHHGPLFEMAVVALNYVFTDHDSRSYFFLRHLLVFSVFLVGIWALFRLGTYWFRDWRWGLLASALLVLSPRFFAEGFYNGKDVVYLAFFTLAMYTLTRLLHRPSLKRAALHGLATALAIDIRVHGVQLVLFTAVGLALAYGSSMPPLRGRQLVRVGLLYLLMVAGGVLAGWPYLWVHSLPELLAVSSHAVRYPWPLTNLYLGKLLPVGQLPWHYIPVWMVVTIPVPYSLAAAVGLLWALFQGRRQRPLWTSETGRLAILMVLWLLGPIVLVMLTHTVVYEGWRHLYYVYPALLLWAVQGIQWVSRLGQSAGPLRVVSRLVLVAAVLETGHTAWRMVQLHPFQNMYFSFLPGPTAERRFERDYWGLSYRRGLEWILANDSARVVTVDTHLHFPLYNNLLILPPPDRARLRYLPDSARYYLAAYRWHPQSYLDSLGTEVHTVWAGDIKILSVFRRR
ncbi:hypothetical protein SAMN06265337_3745 [Hymenobacter gelipurpurascens]|uniref:Dolichyl-phosphate-mannose-protein mannosyltransferase n=1 Tax=Hymenobacter gelipurpurascens TaxID=89968 RepID=A0A212UG15_9BACT|nr:hypothetical protein [Hymenobacter gelipurpurascens]SNC77165.1 hypothetical protein SAMN06265337_3745 [Hymenobacter gelipurpurascens]